MLKNKISVALCTYNGEKYIEAQLNSILNQSLPVDEIVICDDGSKDKTIDILNLFQEKYPTIIKVFFNEINLKSNKNFEKAITICEGDFIFLSDQDDVWVNDKVEKVLDIFSKNPDIEGVFSNANLINDDEIIFTKTTLWDSVSFIETILPKPIDLFQYISTYNNIVTGATLCIKKETKEFIFPFPETSIIFHDEWIALLLSSRNTLQYTTDKLISYRIHSAQQIGVPSESKLEKKAKLIQYILGNNQSNTFDELKIIRKIHYENYYKHQKLKSNYPTLKTLDLDTIKNTNFNHISNIENRMKQNNFFLYYYIKLNDKLRGKRQL